MLFLLLLLLMLLLLVMALESGAESGRVAVGDEAREHLVHASIEPQLTGHCQRQGGACWTVV